MTDKKHPSPEEIQREFEDFVRQRFGGSVQVMTNVGEVPPPAQKTIETAPPPAQEKVLPEDFAFTPKEVKAHLDSFVIKQDEAKKALAIAVCDHYNRVREYIKQGEDEDYEYSKQNVLLLGPTGVGKSYLIKQIAKLIGVPFVKADATRFTEMGYVGANADDLIRDLVQQAKGELDVAQFGIVYLDEADKLAGSQNAGGRDVSGRGTQFSFLKLMEETEVDLQAGNDPASQMQAFMEMQQKGNVARKVINTRHILFIVSGAFTGLEEIIQNRLNASRIGFSLESESTGYDDDTFWLQHSATEDFVKFGFEPEFIGRLPVRVACHHLSPADLYEILKNSKGSIIKQYRESFAHYGITATFEDDALHEIANLAHQQKTGARALMTVCEQIFRDFKFELPSHGVRELKITKDLILHPIKTLEGIISKQADGPSSDIWDQIKEFEASYLSQFGMTLKFDQSAVRAIFENIKSNDSSVMKFCDGLLKECEFGLKLIQQNTGKNEFMISEDLVNNPKTVLEKWIKDSYEESDC